MRGILWGVGALSLAAAAHAQLVVPGADGSDGALDVTSNRTIDLALANTGAWNSTPTTAGNGVYDPEQWAVVFKYSSVNIAAGNLFFSNHPSRAPVVWLVSGDVTIDGWVHASGSDSTTNGGPTEPGPGGFRGGERCQATNTPPPSGPGSAGFGPGGGGTYGSCADSRLGGGGNGSAGVGFGGATELGGQAYGSATAIPLLGGSGGARAYNAVPTTGGSGGGAILIAAQGTISINGRILANSGQQGLSASGAGGTIRLVCSNLTGSGLLSANPNNGGGLGRIRIEANIASLPNGNISPSTTPVPAPATAVLWPDASAPKLAITNMGGVPLGVDTRGRTELGLQDASLTRPGIYDVILRTRNMNPTQWGVRVRVVPINGPDSRIDAVLVSGNTQEAFWRAEIPFGRGATVLIGAGYRIIGGVPQLPSVFSREASGYSINCWADLDSDGEFSNGGTPDGAVTIEDLLFFLSAFEAGDVLADLDDDGLDPANPDEAVTIEDLLYFLIHFEAGC